MALKWEWEWDTGMGWDGMGGSLMDDMNEMNGFDITHGLRMGN
jgi:hypothetical protein